MLKKILSVFISILLFTSFTIVVNATDKKITLTGIESGTTGDCTWTLDNASGTLTISGEGKMGDAFWESKKSLVEKVEIENGVTSISDSAFLSCSNLKNVTIPDSVKSIGKLAFFACHSLMSITIPDSVTSIDRSAFAFCTSLMFVYISENITCIDDSLFWECSSLKNITIPDSVTSIGFCAFTGCTSLSSIDIPCNVTSINEVAFADCTSLKIFNVSERNKNYSSLNGDLYNKDKTNLIQYAIGKTNTSFVVPESVVTFGDYAFRDCLSLISVTMPDGLVSIYGNVFYGCSNLRRIFIPKSVTSIEDESIGYYEDNGSKVKVKNFVVCGYSNSEAEKYAIANGFEFVNLQKAPKITAKSYEKTYGNKPFNLKAKTSGDGKLSYKSSNKKVATVSSIGEVRIKGCGKATITIKASKTSECLSATKKITIIVKPGKIKLKTKKLYKKGNKYCIKQYFVKQKNCDGYESQMSPKKNFPKVYTKPKYIRKTKNYAYRSSLYSGRKLYIKIRSYKKIGKKTYYGKWSKTVIFKT